MFEAIQFIEYRSQSEPEETRLGEFEVEMDAVESARDARRKFMTGDETEYAWWLVRENGARLANFIADSNSDKEFVLDLTSGELVEIT